ncbi:hypothetical protein PCASD_21742, partial [Puccinia coronata f. sp. avenae]
WTPENKTLHPAQNYCAFDPQALPPWWPFKIFYQLSNRRAPLLAPYGLRLEIGGSTPSVITLKHRQKMHVIAVALQLLITLVHPMSSRVHPDPAGLPAVVQPPTTQPYLNHLPLQHRGYCVQHRGIAVVTSPGVKCQKEGCGTYLPHTYHQCQDCNQDTRQTELAAHFCLAHWYLRPQNS